MIWGGHISLGALLLLGAVPVQAAPSLLIQDGDDLFLPPPADTPVYVYEVTWPETRAWTPWTSGKQAADDLRHEVRPEPFTVESVDEKAHRLIVRTSPDGRDLMRRFGAKVAGPEHNALRQTCTDVFVDFTLGKTAPPLKTFDLYPNRQCPWGERIDPSRKLIVEGLDVRRRRLFAAASDDPRWAIHETADEKGNIRLLGMGREDRPTSYVTFSAPPFGDRLKSLRIWQFAGDGKGRVIATINLVAAARK